MIHKLAKQLAPVATLALGASLSGCAFIVSDFSNDIEGVPLTELDMSAPAPDSIVLAGPDKIIISEGDELAITLEGNSEAGEALRFDRDGDSLAIGRDSDVYDGSGQAIVRITMPAPQELTIAGSGDIESFSLADKADVTIAGSGDISFGPISSENLEISIAGSGSVSGSGTAQDLDIGIAGSGNVILTELNAQNADVEIAGSGNVEFASDGTVSANLVGAGDIVVTGSASCTSNNIGAGNLTCRPAPTAETAAITEATEEGEEAGAEAE